MTMTKANLDREEGCWRQKEIADQLKASGALDEIFAKIDAGEALTGEQGLIGGMLKAALEPWFGGGVDRARRLRARRCGSVAA